jgi:hypothetical protein
MFLQARTCKVATTELSEAGSPVFKTPPLILPSIADGCQSHNLAIIVPVLMEYPPNMILMLIQLVIGELPLCLTDN